MVPAGKLVRGQKLIAAAKSHPLNPALTPPFLAFAGYSLI